MLSRLLYYLVILPISYLPYPLLYAFSDFVFLIFYYLVGYRKQVVYTNMKNSFPDKSDAELNKLGKLFYRHFVDLLLEALKNFTISEKSAAKRMKTLNPELPNKFFDEGKSIVIVGGHFNNWELWAVAASIGLKHTIYGIYKKLKDQYFDEKMRVSRGKFGMKLVSTKEVKEALKKNDQELIATVFAVDQSPSNPEKSYWMKFLNQDTACYYGAEKYAKEYNAPVVYGHLVKVKRGHYEMTYECLFEEPKKAGYGEIIEKIHEKLEEEILEHPQYWLWTHKRWKHKRPEKLDNTNS